MTERLNSLERLVSAISSTSPQLARLEEKITAVESAVTNTDEDAEDDQIVQLRDQLIERVKGGEFNDIEYRQGMLVICIAPQNVVTENLPLHDHENSLRVQPLYASGWNHHRHGNRFVTVSKWGEITDAITEINNRGIISAAGHEVISVSRRYFDMGNVPTDIHCIPSVAFEKTIIQAVKSYLSVYNDLGIAPPFDVSMGLINLGQSSLVVGPRIFADGRVLKSDEILPPPVTITDSEEYESPQNLARVLQPVFDFIWREYNYPRSLNYDGNGEWVGH